jgi:hypothetical protein
MSGANEFGGPITGVLDFGFQQGLDEGLFDFGLFVFRESGIFEIGGGANIVDFVFVTQAIFHNNIGGVFIDGAFYVFCLCDRTPLLVSDE